MLHLPPLSTIAFAVIALAVAAPPAFSADSAAKKRCTELIGFYDRWGTQGLSAAQAEIERLRLIVQNLQRQQFGRRAERLTGDRS